MQAFSPLVGCKLQEIIPGLDEQVSLRFDRAVLGIYNPVRTSSGNWENGYLDSVVANLETSETEFVIHFDSGDSLSISIAPDSFVGPEAMSVQFEDGSIAVWQ